MNRLLATTILTAAVALSAAAQEAKISKKDLPPAVQKAVDAQTKGAQIVGYSKEMEKGKTSYEVETKLNGVTTDYEFAADGKLLATEEETPIAAIPPAAKSALEKKAGTGKITKVERITKGETVMFEAAITPKSGKKFEAVVDGGGKPVKD